MSDDRPNPLDKLKAEAALKAAKLGLSAAAERALDAVESAIFGKVGEAARVARAEDEASPLDRARARYGLSEPAPPATPPEDPMEKARAQLAALKASRQGAAETGASTEAKPEPSHVEEPQERKRTL